jgi:ABC-type lipopolysaccharide export system ATPase subunit
MFISQDSALTASFSVAVHLEAVSRTFGKEDNLDTVLSLLALSTLVERMPRDLSGGERQRVSLGLAMLREPDCLLMDEPFAGVAPVDVPAIGGALLALRNSGVGIAISGHDVRQIFDVSDEVIWMVAGTTHWLGAPAQARAHDQFRREYLGPRAMVD